MDLSQTEELFHDLGGFAQERFGFKKPPTLHLVSDHENASKPLGKTAYYDPQSMSITIYTDNRHTKDILRSLAHELVHHTQNENGMLNDTGYHGNGYAQKNKNLRQSEKEAYLKGNMCFRDWEDGLKQSKPTIYNEWRIKTMSTKKWKNNELMENISEKFGFKMNLKTLNESNKKQYDLQEDKEEPYFGASGQEQRGYLLDNGEWLPLGSPEAKAHEAEMLKQFRMQAEPKFPAMTPHDPKKMMRIGNDGETKPMFPDMIKEEEDLEMTTVNGKKVPKFAADGKGKNDLKKGKKDNESDEEENEKSKGDKDVSKVPKQLQQHVKNSMKESRMMKIIKQEILKQLKERK